MRVAFITHYSDLYGANRSLLNLIDGLMPRGVQAHVIVPDEGDLVACLQERNVPYLVAPHQMWSCFIPPVEGILSRIRQELGRRRGAFSRLTANLSIIGEVVRQLKAWDIDIVYTNASVMPIGALVAWRMKKPHVWHLREFGDLDYFLLPDWGRWFAEFLLRRADAQICVSEAIRSHYANGLREQTCHVVYNGVATEAEMDAFHGEAAGCTAGNDEFVFALVGLIHPGKGQDVAVRALGLLKESGLRVRLIVAGGGSDLQPLRDLAAECGVEEQVTFWGYAANPYEVYLRSDAVLMCSKNEAMGRVTVEAMAAVKPVIGYNSGGTAELIVHEYNGLLYKGAEEELAACMLRLAENPAWAREMGENGWRTAREKYTVEACSASIYRVLFDVAARPIPS